MSKYLLMQLSSTKSWRDSTAVIGGLADVHIEDERGAGAAYMVTGDEETFRLLYHLIPSNRTQYDWLRIYVGF